MAHPGWPLSIRVFHWSNAALCLAAFFWLPGGGDAHALAGYGVAGLVVWRIGRGLSGGGEAAFRAFWPTPARVRQYLAVFPDRDGEFPGHNPLGGAMVLVLLAGLLLTAGSGWLQGTDRFWGEAWVQDLHAMAARGVMAAVVVHVVAVLGMQRVSGRPLLRGMLAGRRRG